MTQKTHGSWVGMGKWVKGKHSLDGHAHSLQALSGKDVCVSMYDESIHEAVRV